MWRAVATFSILKLEATHVVSTAMSTLAGLLNNMINQDKLNSTISKCPANDSSNNSLSKLASVMAQFKQLAITKENKLMFLSHNVDYVC